MIFPSSVCVLKQVLLLLSIKLQYDLVSSTFQYGCSSRGCSPHGTFALTTPLPPKTPTVKWTWTDGLTRPGFMTRGCSSSFAVITCPTDKGYVSLDNPTGRKLWQTSGNMTRPFLPLIDFFGNEVTSDPTSFKLVMWDGSIQAEVSLDNFRPEFGAVMANYSVLVITSSNATTDQLLTYNTGGIVFAFSHLVGALSGVSGTFVPCGHPVVNVMRVYLVTCFLPDNPAVPGARAVTGARRLYAIDLTGDTQPPNHVAWHQDLPRHPQGFLMPQPGHHGHSVLAFHNGSVYVNTAGLPSGEKVTSGQPEASTLCAVRDHGNSPTLAFHTNSFPGQLAAYDVTQSWDNTTATGVRPVWVVSETPAVLTAHHPDTGNVLARLDVDSLAQGAGGRITSDVMVTRKAAQPDRDMLVFGTQNSQGHAFVVALEAGLPPLKPRLLWSYDMSAGSHDTSTWRVGGQIASVALTADEGWTFGLAVSAVETRTNSTLLPVLHVILLM